MFSIGLMEVLVILAILGAGVLGTEPQAELVDGRPGRLGAPGDGQRVRVLDIAGHGPEVIVVPVRHEHDVAAFDDLAVHFHDYPQYAVGRWMLGPKIHGVVSNLGHQPDASPGSYV